MQVSQESLASLAGLASGRMPLDAVSAHLWPAIVALASRHGLAPLLTYRLREPGIDLPAVDLEPLKQAARRCATHYIILEAAQAQLEDALRAANVATIWIKGIALAQTLYPDPTLRPMNDLDVLIPYDRRHDALLVAQKQGYRFPVSPASLLGTGDGPLAQRVTHHFHLVGGPAQMVTVELHGRLLSISSDVLPLEELAWFQGQTSPCCTQSTEFLTLNPTAHLLYLCAHAELQHAELYLLRYLDLHLLVTGTPPDWSLLIERAATLRWTTAVESALQISTKLFDTQVPTDVFEQLQAQRPAREDATRIGALKAKGARWVRVRRLLSALSLADRLRLVIRIIFPSPAYMRSRYAVAAGLPVWPCYFYRWLGQAREVFYAIKRRWTVLNRK